MATKLDDPRIIEFDVRTDEMLVNMGPQHPSTHGVLRLVLRSMGKWCRRGNAPYRPICIVVPKKIGENLTPAVDSLHRSDGLPGRHEHEPGLVADDRKADALELPEKAKHLRVIIAEMGRIASLPGGYGCLWVGSGFVQSVFICVSRAKRFWTCSGGVRRALTYSYLTVGGATHDLPREVAAKCEQFLDQFVPVISEYHTLLTTNAIFVRRAANIGVLSPEQAIAYGCTGPVLRGSGVDQDLRRDGEEWYTDMYDGYAFEVIVQKNGHYPKDHDYPPIPTGTVLGDCWHRFYVRMLEVMQSIDLVRQAMDRYSTAQGSHCVPVKLTEKLPKGDAYLETECPKGQMGFYVVSNGTPVPWRVRARSSCFCNLSVVAELCRGALIADIPAVLGSLDIVMGEIDR